MVLSRSDNVWDFTNVHLKSGSYATETQSTFSDIDIAYKIDYDKFSKNYKAGFSKILRIDDIKEELQQTFKTKIDFVPDNNKSILSDIIYL